MPILNAQQVQQLQTLISSERWFATLDPYDDNDRAVEVEPLIDQSSDGWFWCAWLHDGKTFSGDCLGETFEEAFIEVNRILDEPPAM